MGRELLRVAPLTSQDSRCSLHKQQRTLSNVTLLAREEQGLSSSEETGPLRETQG